METPITKEKMKEMFSVFLTTLQEVAERWSTSILVACKLLGSLWLFAAIMGIIIVSTQWFIVSFGAGTFVFTLIVSSFVLTVLTTMASKQK
jgi:hypothetical protein